ncbi:DUF4232 domain-containing protein [Kitasatospora sp. NPDC050463]|uniref:DUF4232 domain-containing protein n=1 Tax=Kitasatospora sp. NPDC050463 TaxID=3155786 RepID=UPI0033F549F4
MDEFEKTGPLSKARRPAAAVALVAVAVTLLAGCGSRPAGTASAGGASSASGTAGPCGVPQPSPSAGAQVPTGSARGGVRITAANAVCAEYEVTNPGSEPADVTVTFSRLDASGGALDSVTRTVTALAPGAVETGRVDLGAIGPVRPGARQQVKILKVRSVPSAEAPRPGGPCPASGLRLSADDGNAAMGLRVVGLSLRNCGTSAVTVNGYPALELLDLEHRPIDGVSILPGGAAIATGTGADDPPRKIVLRPGEGARAALVWRNTTEAGESVNAPYVRVRATPDAAPVMVTPELDLGTTGRLGVGAWTRDEQPPATGPSAAR